MTSILAIVLSGLGVISGAGGFALFIPMALACLVFGLNRDVE